MRRASLAFLGLALLASTGCDRGQFAEGFATDNEFRQESFEQVEAVPVDILFVVDTSCSMADEQEALAENFPQFIEFFADEVLPFRIGITSTNINDPDSDGLDGALNGDPRWLEPDTPNFEAKFFEHALMGIDEGHGDEAGLHAAYVALEERIDDVNADFIRDWANLSIIVVSDEPDFSTRGAPNSGEFTDADAFAPWLDGYKDTPEASQLSALVGISEDGIDAPDGCLHPWANPQDNHNGNGGEGAERGDGYLEAAIATGGATHSLCSEDWGEMMGHLGLTTAGLEDTFVLSEVPLLHTLRVSVGGVHNIDWVWDAEANAVTFVSYETLPRPGETVAVEYHVPEPD
ncbi:MAG: hypothetical protein GY898_11060 [Proteobacteria bacterium]|nr:hypothetical protein [Pseudomonadota bacterium]